MGTLMQDIRFGIRMLLKKPGFTLVALFTLALGIGANTAMFTVVNAVLLRPLPYPDSERLMEIGRAYPGNEFGSNVSEPKFNFLRDQTQSFEAVTATQGIPNLYISDDNQTEYIRGLSVSAEFFAVMGVAPRAGRGFTKEEDSPAGARVAVLSDGFWRRRFGLDEAVIGKPITLNNNVYTVVGIMPPGFEYFGPQDVILPMRVNPGSTNEGHNLTVIARLKNGLTTDQARNELNLVFERFRAAFPKQANPNETFGGQSWRLNMTGQVRDLLWILLAAVSMVLLIACANVANLQLTRAASRQREMAIRMAIGGSSWRLIRQLLTEGIILSLAGGFAGLLLATWGLDAMRKLIPENMIPRASEIGLDWRVLIFCLGTSVITGIAFGLAPAWRLLRLDVNAGLKEGAGKATAGSGRARLRSVLVVVEVAMALTLTVGAGLLLRTFANLRSVEPGFDAQNLLSFQVSPRAKEYDSLAKVQDLYVRGLDRFRGLPGVESVALTSKLPLDAWLNFPYRLAGKTDFTGSTEYRLISPEYFRVMRMALLRGREFDQNDSAGGEAVIIVNEAFARRNFPGAEALDQQFCVGCDKFDPAMRRVVGVVNDTKQRSPGAPSPPTVFIPIAQTPEGAGSMLRQSSFVLRTTGDPLQLSGPITNEVRQLDPGLPIKNLRSMDQLVSRSIAPQRFNFSLLSLFAALGLLLAAVGIYGVMAYSVSQRTQEIGLRMALGAQVRDVLRLILKQGLTLAIIGVGVGLIASFAVTRLMKSLLFNVSTTDPITMIGVSLLLTCVAILACYLPARRATKISPLEALRYE